MGNSGSKEAVETFYNQDTRNAIKKTNDAIKKNKKDQENLNKSILSKNIDIKKLNNLIKRANEKGSAHGEIYIPNVSGMNFDTRQAFVELTKLHGFESKYTDYLVPDEEGDFTIKEIETKRQGSTYSVAGEEFETFITELAGKSFESIEEYMNFLALHQ